MYQKVIDFFNKKKVVLISIIAMIMVFFAISFIYSLTRPLNYDELEWTINFMDDGFSSMMEQLSTGLYNLPLFYILAYPIYHILPHTEMWLCLPNILLTIGSLIFVYLFVKDFKNNIWALIILFLLCINASLIEFVVQFRPYALMFFLVSALLYVWFKREKDGGIKINVFYTILSALLMSTHWFGSLLVASFGVFDLVKIITKKKNFKQLIPYVIMLVCFVPYFIVVVLKSRYTTDYYWQNPASIAFGIECVSVFLNCNMFFFAVFVVGGIVIAFKTYKAIFKKQEIEDIEYWSFFAITVFLTFFAIQFYSMVINKNTSLCVFRYFITLLPFITLMFLYGAKSVIDFIFAKKRFFMLFLSCVALIVFTVPAGMVCVDSLKSTNKGYENVVCFLLEQEDIKNDKTLVAATCGSTWVDFYFTEKGRELPQNVIASHLDLYFDNFFTQSVKDGKRIEDTKVYNIYNWILGFDKIYFYSESYKELNDQKAFMDYVLENYEYKEETIESLIVFTKKA